MIATFNPCCLEGHVDAPPSKSMAHRYLIGAALCGKTCSLSGIDYSEDIQATLDCLTALGVTVTRENHRVTIDPSAFGSVESPVLSCRESGSTLRFFLPLALCLGKPVTFKGSQRLLERPLEIYEDLCREQGFLFQRNRDSITVCGHLKSGDYTLRGDISSQFITGLLFAMVYRNEAATIRIQPPFESRPYIHLTISAMQSFGANVYFADARTITIQKEKLRPCSGRIEGDYSNAAFLDAFNHLGSRISIGNLNPDSLQGDRVFRDYFRQISEGMPTLDISDYPDLGPVLIALAALKNGAVFTGTDRLRIKESDRGLAMQEELSKLGGGVIFGDNSITVPKQTLSWKNTVLNGHNDHRIVMALSVILSKTGGSIEGAEAVGKSYPGFFKEIQKLGAKVTLKDPET